MNKTKLDRSNRSKIQIEDGIPTSETRGNIYIDNNTLDLYLRKVGETSWEKKTGNDIPRIEIEVNGTVTVDTFLDTDFTACSWNYLVKKTSDGSVRAGTIVVCWKASSDEVSLVESCTNDIGTTDIVFSADILSNSVRLRCTSGSNHTVILRRLTL